LLKAVLIWSGVISLPPRPAINPFIIGFFSFAATRYLEQRLKMGRSLAVVLVHLSFFLSFLGVYYLILTSAMSQAESLQARLPSIKQNLNDFRYNYAKKYPNLAVLFGFSQIAETRTLVHIRSGEQLRANGFLPGSSDAFAYSLESKPTANVSWLFDHVVSAAYAAGGEYGLTIFKALIAGLIAYFLSLISVPGMPTWWSFPCIARKHSTVSRRLSR